MNMLRDGVILICLLSLGTFGCSESGADGPSGQRSIVDAGGLDAAMATGLECLTDDDCRSSERCKHFGDTSQCVLGCGSDDDCPSTQPTCELYASGDGICIRRCRTDGMCGEDEVCETRDGDFGACVPAPPEDIVGFAGTMGQGGSDSGTKFQCTTDANCPLGYRCVEGEDGTRFCEENEPMGGSAGDGGAGGEGGAAGEGGAGGEAGSGEAGAQAGEIPDVGPRWGRGATGY